MVIRTVIKKNAYRDSIFLMKMSAQAKKESGVEAVSAMMATERNKDLFTASGLMTPEIQDAKANDLAIAIKADDGNADKAIDLVMQLLDQAPVTKKAAGNGSAAAPVTLSQAMGVRPDLNLALISVAGDYARYEAALALNAGLDVMLYSDNISLANELALKKMAQKKGLMVMGPDCGTAIINGTPLAFANAVTKGPVGIVGASGTGLQEVCCLLDRMGIGISQAYGTGGRDLKDDIGGITSLTALERLAADKETTAIVMLGKPPGEKTRAVILDRCAKLGKPVFIHYIGAKDHAQEEKAGIKTARDLTELALITAKHFNPSAAIPGSEDAPTPGKAPGLLCGLFGGGTLCQEAAEICGPLLKGDKATNLSVEGYKKISGKDAFSGHVLWDLGEDEFTVGRPHPMMAPDLKMERFVKALVDPKVSVVLMDMVIGFGSHPDQANLAVEAIEQAKKQNGKAASTVIVASVCGTEKDTPALSAEAATLRKAGVVVLSSNAAAARYAAATVAG